MSNISTKPYLIRAIYEWCTDQGYTPYIAAVVDEETRVPPGYARDGQIVLNVGQDATHQLHMDNDLITFQARFNGVVHSLVIPVGNVVAIYARENGHGMAFEVEGAAEADVAGDAPAASTPAPVPVESSTDGGSRPPPRGNHLKIVK
ncbi:ClpXP protease specificity-enhancing factor [Azoarcus olearius]|uniref:Stringent starvation protein B n=1 Tax=Azoarcus sp. (strain BH72) TaxID=418699 RepID=A1K426_AZOSB|nr:ClpXP protease specificity-enhancing factor [Azoarcus olearius]ANQ84103.1 ClpXP protease specificity-enhancing factor [Azoarcus olearius]CAL93581.1 putative stringent starvation protein B [Azoarcus olearius]